jgi:hypothetical protein
MKIDDDTIQISKRFYAALDALKVRGDLTGVKTFTDKYGINRWNLIETRNNPEKQSVRMVWIAHLARDYGVSSHWVLTGQGVMFVKG